MAFTLEAALVLPLSISLLIGTIPPAINSYKQAAAEAMQLRQAARLTADPSALYLLTEIEPATVGTNAEVLLTSPKLMFCLVTAVIDDFRIIGAGKP